MLGRPHRVAPLLESIRAATPDARVLFLCDREDVDEQRAIRAADGRFTICDGGYAAKINLGVRTTDEPLIFLGADDLDFRPGWFEAAESLLDDQVGVVGVNDLIERSFEHATHFLLTRAYAERPLADGEPGPMSTAYHHWYVDNELIDTARARGAYAYAPDAEVEHLHPLVHKAPLDETYERGAAQSDADRKIFNQRRVLWA